MEINKRTIQTLKLLGLQLATFRKEWGLTQLVLAKKAGVSKRTIERLENGFSIQTVTLLKILEVFDLNLFLNKVKPVAQSHQAQTYNPSKTTKPLTKSLNKSRSWGALD